MRFQLFDYLRFTKVPYRESGKNIGEGWIGICCPNCRDQSYHLGVNRETGNFYCWICGEKGNLSQLIVLIENIPFNEAYQRIKEFQPDYPVIDTNTSLSDYLINLFAKPEQLSTEANSKTCTLPQHIVPLTHAYHYSQCMEYLRVRGYSKEDFEKWDAYFCYAGKYKYRIIFPLTINGQLMTYTGRTIYDVDPRYLNAKKSESITSARNCIFNYDRIESGSDIILVEGVFDCLKVEKLSGIRTVALMGKVASHHQKLLLMSKKLRRVWVMLDKDAWKETLILQKTLSSLLSCPIHASFLKEWKDPGEISTREECISLL